MIQSKEISLVSIRDIKINPKNRNKHHNDQIDRLSKIIEYQGFRAPLIVSNRTGLLVAGHGRLAAAKKLKLKEVPVMFQDFIDEAQEYAAMVSDNAIGYWSELDLSGINEDIGDLGPEFDLDLLGIKGFEVDVADKEPGCDEDEVPEHVEPKTKLGDIYTLGTHRLMCGDSTSVDAVEKLMSGEKADMVYTDPPYGISYDDKACSKKPKQTNKAKTNNFGMIRNDDVEFDPGILFGFFHECREVFVWGALNFCQSLPRGGSWIIWDKKTEAQSDCPHGDFDACFSLRKHSWDMVRVMWGGFHSKEKGEDRLHPTQKPVKLHEWFFERWGKDQDVVVDMYGGSGSTLIACEKTNRKCFMMELDSHYVDVIVARWEKYTGQKAELTNG